MAQRCRLADGASLDSLIRRCGRHSGTCRASERSPRLASTHRKASSSRAVKHSPGFLKLVDDAKSRVREISIEDTRRKLEAGTARVIDVREESEWAAGHIAGAEYIGRGVLERDIEEKIPHRNAELILYCGGGFRSALAADNLQKMGYANVTSMEGGWRSWKERGYPASGESAR
jgi:rhodanese-related sulfurtransferase